MPILVLMTVLSGSGCSVLQSAPADPLAVDDADTRVTDPTVVVELRSGDDSPQYLRAPLQESMLVQDALKGSGAIRQFKRMNVVLVRNMPGGRKLRLPVAFNANTRRVVDEHNYALHGGDWLEVTEDTSTTLDRMIEQALQPLRPMMRTYRD